MFDVTVIGAGPVGATFAALLQSRLPAGRRRIALLEARVGAATEERTLALSHGSALILGEAGAWDGASGATEIHRIHTSQKGGFGRTLIDRRDARVAALGYVLSYSRLQSALDQRLAACAIPVMRGAAVSEIVPTKDHVDVVYRLNEATHTLSTRALVLADGGANLAKVPALVTREKDYHQVAMLGRLQCDTAHRNIAYERFTPEGPAALLPLGDPDLFSMVWVSSAERIAALMAHDDAYCCAAFQSHFGLRAGRFLSLSARNDFPLKLRTVCPRVSGRIAVIGNAAQALHPVAGQGFNVGLRDAQTLAECLGETAEISPALTRYASLRADDVERSVGFTDFLVSAFSGNGFGLNTLRGLGLLAVDTNPLARRMLARRMLYGATR